MTMTWDARIDALWDEFDGSRPDEMIALMRALVDERPADDAAALYEMASIYDSTGRTSDAIGLYRLAIDAGLDDERAPQATLQMASSLRADGKPTECLEVLDEWEASDQSPSPVIGAADAVVRALALNNLGRHDEALRVALLAIAPTLPRYNRSMTAYAEALVESNNQVESNN
jgi:tetratricopeptide (TPR) repeat protein